MTVRRTIRAALGAANRAGVHEVRRWHVTPARRSELAEATLAYLHDVATRPSKLGDDWRMVSARNAGVLPWWAGEAGLSDAERRRVRPLRTDVYDDLVDDRLIVKDPGQGSPIHVPTDPRPAHRRSSSQSKAGRKPIVTRDNLGAWMVKCNPNTWDLAGFLADGGTVIGPGWAVQDNYRSQLMRYEDPVFFWVSGSDADTPPGLWGLGRVLDEPDWDVPDEYWLDEAAALDAEYFVPVTIPLLDEPLARADIAADPRLADLEVLRSPQMGNPQHVTPEQAEALFELVGDPPPPDPQLDQITVSAHGAGFGDPLKNAIVEQAAMAAARAHLKAGNWTVKNVSEQKLGWDLTARRNRDELHVEVKGVSRTKPTILLTRNEHRKAQTDPAWVLMVVTEALSRPRVRRFDAATVVAASEPFVFRTVLSPETSIGSP